LPNHLNESLTLSEHRRPLSALASGLKIEHLALFVNLKDLALTQDSDKQKTLEKLTGNTKESALTYFLEVFPWPDEERAVLNDPDNAVQYGKAALVAHLLQYGGYGDIHAPPPCEA